MLSASHHVALSSALSQAGARTFSLSSPLVDATIKAAGTGILKHKTVSDILKGRGLKSSGSLAASSRSRPGLCRAYHTRPFSEMSSRCYYRENGSLTALPRRSELSRTFISTSRVSADIDQVDREESTKVWVDEMLASLPRPLNSFFHPKGVAVVGATEKAGSVGRTVLQNLLGSPFGGAVFPINPKRPNVLGVKAYPTIASIDDKVDLAVVCTPAAHVPVIITDCAQAGVKNVIIISAGFAEEQVGDGGKELLAQVMRIAKENDIRVVGPNCVGVYCPVSGLNATFGPPQVKKGSIGLISQSGALICSIIDWSLTENFGFSHIVSLGSMADVSWGDVIDHLGKDPECKSIVMYMETIGDARSFMAAARRVAMTKPIIVIKAGRTEAGAKAAASHTGSMTGGDSVLDTAFERCGVLRVNSVNDVFYLADHLANQPLPKSNRMTIVTNAGGPGILCADALSLGGGELAELSPETHEKLNKFLPSVWSHSNPVDIIGDANAEQYAKTVQVVAEDPNTDGVCVILTPQAMTESTETAARMVELLKVTAQEKPVVGAWMGGLEVKAGMEILRKNNIPVVPFADLAATIFNYMWQYTARIKALYEVPESSAVVNLSDTGRKEAKEMIAKARNNGVTFLSEYESKKLLELYDIPVTPMVHATTAAEGARGADTLGYPVVVKLHSNTLTHKADVGGVVLNVQNAETVAKCFEDMHARIPAADFGGVTVQPMLKLEHGYEVIVGCNLDPQIGPVLLFGTGGSLVEVYKDSTLELPPLNHSLAGKMIHKTKIADVFKGVRGRKAIDEHEVQRILVQFSELVVQQPFIKEIEINPLFCSPEKIIALDARVVLHDADTKLEEIPRPAIREYPRQYVTTASLAGKTFLFRPTRPEDENTIDEFFQRQAAEQELKGFYGRYFATKDKKSLLEDRLLSLCCGEYTNEIALLAFDVSTEKPQMQALARLTKFVGTHEAEFAVFVGHEAKNIGLGRELLKQVLDMAKDEGVRVLTGKIANTNDNMIRLAKSYGFSLRPLDAHGVFSIAELDVDESTHATESVAA